MRRISRVNWSVGLVIASAALFSVGCSGTVSTGNGQGESELPLDEGSGAATSGSLGDGTSCEMHDHWKLLAYETCLEQGLTLVELTYAEDCANGGSTSVDYACAEPSPPPEPDPGSCAVEILGDGTTCKDPGTWKMLIAGDGTTPDICSAQGLYLHDASFFNDCADGGSTTVKVTCCPSANVPPEPDPNAQVCVSDALGDGTICKTEEGWNADIEQICGSKGLTVVAVGFANNCADGSSSYAKFTCCEP